MCSADENKLNLKSVLENQRHKFWFLCLCLRVDDRARGYIDIIVMMVACEHGDDDSDGEGDMVRMMLIVMVMLDCW